MKIIDEHGMLETYPVRYEDVKVGDEIVTSRKGDTSKVIKVEKWETSSSQLMGLMYKLTFDNGNANFGYADRTLKKVN